MDMQFEDDDGFITALEQAIVLGIPVDVKQTYERLNQIVGRGVGMESHSFKKNALTISLEDIGIAKGAMVAAGIVALGVILKKIYDWIMGFFKSGSSGGSGSGGTAQQVKVMSVLSNTQPMATAINSAMHNYSMHAGGNDKVGETTSKIFTFDQLVMTLPRNVADIQKYAEAYGAAMSAYRVADAKMDRIYDVIQHDRRNQTLHNSPEIQKLKELLTIAEEKLDVLDSLVIRGDIQMQDDLAKVTVQQFTAALTTNFNKLTSLSRLTDKEMTELRDNVKDSMDASKKYEQTASTDSDKEEVALLKLHARVLNKTVNAAHKMGSQMLHVAEAVIRACNHANGGRKGSKNKGAVDNMHALATDIKRMIEEGK